MNRAAIIRAIISACLAAILLSGCGRAGDPLKPSEAARDAAKDENRPLPPRPTPNAENPDKRFILDGLLE